MRNPKWHKDEAILVLDLYFNKNLGSVSSHNPEVISLSELLNKLPIHLCKPDKQKFRNPNGVVMKLANFKSIDPNYKGKGLQACSKLEKDVFEEFCSDIERLHKMANDIKLRLDHSEISIKMIQVKND